MPATNWTTPELSSLPSTSKGTRPVRSLPPPLFFQNRYGLGRARTSVSLRWPPPGHLGLTPTLPFTGDRPLHSQNRPRTKCRFQPIKTQLSRAFEGHALAPMISKPSPAPHPGRRVQSQDGPICSREGIRGTGKAHQSVKRTLGRDISHWSSLPEKGRASTRKTTI